MTLSKSLYNLIDTGFNNNKITIPEYWAGVATKDTAAKTGLLTFFPLPSPGAGFADNVSVTQYQFDIWHSDMYQAEDYKEEVINYLHGTAGNQDGMDLIISMDSDQGGIFEDNSEIWHYVVIFNIKYTRRIT